MPDVVIVGSGLAGLACAAALAQQADCLIVERLPVAGGEQWADREIRSLVRRATDHGATVEAATQAIRWDGAQVTLIGQTSRIVRSGAVIVATGHRPATRGELGIVGSRCGGILPGTVVEHLVDHGVIVGREPLVVGGGELALSLVDKLLDRHCDVQLASPGRALTEIQPTPGLRYYPEASPLAVHGDDRVERVTLRRSDGKICDLACDALVLASGRIPYRNVDGATFDSPGVLFAQSGSEDPQSSRLCGEAAAEEVAAVLDRPATEFAVPTRIGPPGITAA